MSTDKIKGGYKFERPRCDCGRKATVRSTFGSELICRFCSRAERNGCIGGPFGAGRAAKPSAIEIFAWPKFGNRQSQTI